MLKEKNTGDEGISKRSVRRFVIVIISEVNQISDKKNFRK